MVTAYAELDDTGPLPWSLPWPLPVLDPTPEPDPEPEIPTPEPEPIFEFGPWPFFELGVD